MVKRKRSEGSPAAPAAEPTADRALKRQRKQCEARIAAAQKPLMAALRAGAGLERQKHSRRKKTATAKKDTKGLARLEAEYAVLKSLNIEKVAEQHVRRTIAKVKSIKDHEALPESAREVEKGSQDPATLNVLARLYKIPGVRKEIDATIDDLKAIVAGTEGSGSGADKAAKVKKVRVQDSDGDDDMADASDDEGAFSAFNARIAAPSSGEDDSEAAMSDDERPPSIGDSASEHDPDDDLNAASDSDDESSASFAGFSSSDARTSASRIAPPSDLSASDSESDSDAIPAPKAKTKTKRTALPDTKPTTSAFIPALSHAAYFSGSDSEASDLDVDMAPRKNRRGQRARQKIAEAKFGAAAKHVQKAARNKGWDPKRGAIGDERAMRTGRGPAISGENAMPLGGVRKEKKKGERDDKGELHPSWQAAKAAKESKKLVIDLKGAASKKVVFD
jgi:hypothetical protein